MQRAEDSVRKEKQFERKNIGCETGANHQANVQVVYLIGGEHR